MSELHDLANPVAAAAAVTDDDANAVASLPVFVKSCSIVQPCKPTPQVTAYLSNLDLTLVFMVDAIYFYSSGSHDVASLLKLALQEALVSFYPLAGRLRISPETRRLELDCNSAGAVLAEAYADIRIQDLGDLSLPNPLFRNLLLTPHSSTKLSDMPLLTFQVTKFKCGGFSLGTSTNHAVCDGSGTIAFMKLFTSIAQRQSSLQPLSLHVDRSILKARAPPRPAYDFGGVYYKSSEMPATQSFTTNEDVENANLSSNYVVTDLTSKTISFSRDTIEALKKVAMADGEMGKCSTFDVVAAHIWRLRTDAVEMQPSQESVMFMAVDVSQKTKAPLPQHFFGNRAFPVFAKATAEQLRSMSLAARVKLVQKVISDVDDEYVRSWIDWSEIHRGIPKFNGGFFLSSWWKFPFYEFDFGFGKPIYTGPVLTQRVEFLLILPVSPSRENGGVDVLLTLKPHEMEKLEKLLLQPVD